VQPSTVAPVAFELPRIGDLEVVAEKALENEKKS